MSAFLGFESYLIPLGSTIADAHTTLRAALTSRGWQIVHDSLLMQIMTTLGTFADATYVKENAFNGISNVDNATSKCYSTAALPLWVGCRLNISTQVLKVAVMGDPATPGNSPRDFTIDWSDNGTAWTTALAVTNQTAWFNYERRYFDIPPSGTHAYWRVNVTAKNGGAGVSILELEFMDQYGNIATNVANTYFDIIPPVTETIGDSRARDILRVEFTATTIGFRAMSQTLVGMPQYVYAAQKTAGNVQAAFTLNGATVTQDAGTMNAANTALQNLRYLYDAIKVSVDPLVTEWAWSIQSPPSQNADTTYEYIVGRRNTVLPLVAMTPNANVLGGTLNYTVPVGMMNFSTYLMDPTSVKTLTIDLANGFIYYLQVNARGIALATKTNLNIFGPIHACYGNNAKAIAAKPSNAPFVSIVELVIGTDTAAASDTSARGMCSHGWGFASTLVALNGNANSFTSTFGGGFELQYTMFDVTYANAVDFVLNASNIWGGDTNLANDFQVHRIGLQGLENWFNSNSATYGYVNVVRPYIEIDDWFKFRGTVVNEALILIADTQMVTTLSTGILLADSPTTIAVASTAGFNTTGFVAILDEIFQYTGISGNTLTGISRAKYGTAARSSYTGDIVSQCLWFTVINGGALLCGYNKPA